MNTPHALCLATASFRLGRRNQRSNMLFLVVSLVLIILSQSVHAAEQPGSDDDLHDAEAKALASLRLHVPADALSERLLTVLPRALFSGGAPEDDPDLSQYLVFGQGGQLYVLGRRQKTIWSIHPTTGKIEVVYRDVRPGLLDFTDFTLLQNELLALADQPRQAVYLFQQRRFWKGLGLLNDRWLFPSPRAVCTNDDRSLLG
ncbi:MAG TPA: hypothetical protein PKO06_16990, partial [Candidatus Ozemobacteraceae bacterium]|nr:hypothetical protein [Candidatus Ozemobacteraceae bacterium]